MTRLLVVTTGSHGDHAPYAGLGRALQQHGHRVTLAGAARFAHLAEDAGVGYATLPEPPVSEERSRRINAGGLRGTRMLIDLGVEDARVRLPAVLAAAEGVDVLAATRATVLYARPVAEALGIPLIVLPLQPAVATAHFTPDGADLGRALNRAVHGIAGQIMTRPFLPAVGELRRELGLPPEDRRRREAGIAAVTVLHGFSATVQPRPADWPATAQVAGYWWPLPPRDWHPSPALLDFLAAGAPPVFVGFGSMVGPHTARLAAAIGDALARTGHRAIVQRGAAELDLDEQGPDVLTVEHVPHGWLFPRVAAVVHHAGAGTTAATLRAGVPSVPVPHAHDQPFWARRLVDLGAAPAALPARSLDGARLASALAQAVGAPAYRHRATRIAGILGAEDSVAAVLDQL